MPIRCTCNFTGRNKCPVHRPGGYFKVPHRQIHDTIAANAPAKKPVIAAPMPTIEPPTIEPDVVIPGLLGVDISLTLEEKVDMVENAMEMTPEILAWTWTKEELDALSWNAIRRLASGHEVSTKRRINLTKNLLGKRGTV